MPQPSQTKLSLFKQADPQNDAQCEPDPRAAAVYQAQQQIRCNRPEGLIDRVHRVVAAHREIHGPRQHAEAGQPLCHPAASQLSCHQAGEHDRRAPRQGRWQTNGEHRLAEQLRPQTQQCDREGRVVHVPPRGAPRAVQEVELVAHPPVRNPCARDDVEQELGSAQAEKDRPGDRRSCSVIHREATSSPPKPTTEPT